MGLRRAIFAHMQPQAIFGLEEQALALDHKGSLQRALERALGKKPQHSLSQGGCKPSPSGEGGMPHLTKLSGHNAQIRLGNERGLSA